MDNVTKALALARIGIKVFPVDAHTRRPVIAEKAGGRGFYDATSDDFEQIATWFTSYDEAKTEVGVWVGGSGLLALDVDRGKKNGKNGFTSIKEAGYDTQLGSTEHYSTASGGEHRVFATDRVDLKPGADVVVGGKKLEGVDIRAGGSYIVWWGDTVPESREAFSTDIPAWIIEASEETEDAFKGEGFSGTVSEWLGTIPDDLLPSGRIRDLLSRIPAEDFGHPQMTDLVWSIVRMGSERETGVQFALNTLKEAWLRNPYNTPKYRRDFDLALRGAIVKAGRVQRPLPAIRPLHAAMSKAVEAGVADDLKALERRVSETDTEIDFARARRAMFKLCAEGDLSAETALGIVTGSKAFKNSKASIESTWFGEGEPQFHEIVVAEEADVAEEQAKIDREIELVKRATRFSDDAAKFTFLTTMEQAAAESYDWWGNDYLKFMQKRLKHFNKPYHVSAMWAVLSVIASPWGKVKSQGSRPMDCNLYLGSFGVSTSGKTESWDSGIDMIDAYFGTDNSPIIGDLSKLTANALHRQLILRDGEPSLVYGDEIQSFFEGISQSQWQSGILGDISSHYGGNVAPKLMINDPLVNGKRAKTMLTAYITGIGDQFLDAISIKQWTNGFFYRFLWGFGQPRAEMDFEVTFDPSPGSYEAQMKAWAEEFRRRGAYQDVKWGLGREVDWEEDARRRISAFSKQIDEAVRSEPLYDEVFVAANTRFLKSIMKCATLVALAQMSETVKLEHVIVALDYAGPWHRSMVLAVSETGKEPFERDVEKCLIWIKRNAIRQVGKPAFIQRSSVMRAFKPNEVADRLLRQLTEEGWLLRSGDLYQLAEGVDK